MPLIYRTAPLPITPLCLSNASSLSSKPPILTKASRIKSGVENASKGNYTEAIRCYDEALGIEPRNIDAMVARGAALANLKQYEAAIGQLEASLKLAPNHTNAKKYLLMIEQKIEADRKALRPSHALEQKKVPPTHSTTSQTDHLMHALEEAVHSKARRSSKSQKGSKSKRVKRSSDIESRHSEPRGRTPDRGKSSVRDRTLSRDSERKRRFSSHAATPPPKRTKQPSP